ncbi:MULTISPECIES: aminotransferase class V-fold PLP-dependent enzyme [unclassified Nonomuraea]|uniref:aminotransferase class V-fold PLP-dependent enzyme n=1 Tax=unclassified Nonomuraea TaxID=2593643 RepID=UPI0033E34579
MNLDAFRACFPVLDRLAWFTTPSSPPAPLPVTRALRAEIDDWEAGEVSWPRRDEAAQRTRGQFARLMRAAPPGAGPGEVALVQSVAEAAATVAASLPPGSRVVVGAEEYRSNLFPWLDAARRGLRVELVPMPDGRLSGEALAGAVTPGTALVAVSHVQSATGWRVDLEPVAARCRETGARLFVDATQSAGVLPLPPGVDPDYVAVHGYKWLLCPRGAAWLYVRPDRLSELHPLAPGPKSTAAPWSEFYGGPLAYAPDARRLDLSLCWPSWAGATAALDLVAGLDPVRLERHCLALAGLLREGAAELGLRCPPSERPSHIVTVEVPDAGDAVRRLEDLGVRVTARVGALRFGFHGFNTPEDVSRALSALRLVTGTAA